MSISYLVITMALDRVQAGVLMIAIGIILYAMYDLGKDTRLTLHTPHTCKPTKSSFSVIFIRMFQSSKFYSLLFPPKVFYSKRFQVPMLTVTELALSKTWSIPSSPNCIARCLEHLLYIYIASELGDISYEDLRTFSSSRVRESNSSWKL